MIKIAVCDDIEIISEDMKTIILNHRFREKVEVDAFTSGKEFLESAIKHKYDIIFMDIQLAQNPSTFDENGMLVSARVKEIYPDVLLVFMTGFAGYERSLLEFEPFRFLDKPFEVRELLEAVEAGIDRIMGWEEKFYSFKFDGLISRISLKHIIYFESRRPYVYIHCINEVVKFRERMDVVEKNMEELSNDYVRASKSFLINMKYIKSFSSKKVILLDGTEILVGRKYGHTFAEKMNNWK